MSMAVPFGMLIRDQTLLSASAMCTGIEDCRYLAPHRLLCAVWLPVTRSSAITWCLTHSCSSCALPLASASACFLSVPDWGQSLAPHCESLTALQAHILPQTGTTPARKNQDWLEHTWLQALPLPITCKGPPLGSRV